MLWSICTGQDTRYKCLTFVPGGGSARYKCGRRRQYASLPLRLFRSFFLIFCSFSFFSSPILKQDHEQLILNHRTYNPSYKSYISQTLKNHNQSHQCIKNIEKSTTTRTRASHLPTPPLGHAAHASPSHAAPARCWARPGTTPRAPIVQIEREK
jgi:hypothetical protein